MKLFFLLALCSVHLSAFVIGNPGQPALDTKSLFLPDYKKVSMRVGYIDDYVYSQHFTNAFSTVPSNEKPAVGKLSTNTAQVTLNFIEKVDLYGIIGSAQLQLDEEVYFQRQLAWGLGVKWVVYTLDKFRIGADFKYFETTQKPLFLVSSGLPLDIATSDLQLCYSEYQVALGFSYVSEWLCPYIAGTYLSSDTDPKPSRFLVHVPGLQTLMDAEIPSHLNKSSWGAAVGATLLMGSKGTLAVESRFMNQNAISATLELRF